jgi:hypothetical protein
MPIDEVLTLEGTVAFDLEPYDKEHPPLVGVIMPNKTRRLFVAPHHPIEGGRVITRMRNGRFVSADFADTELANWLRAKVGAVLSIESFGFYQSGSLAIMDWDAMENLTNLPSWMYARATHVSKYVNVGFKLYTDCEASRKGAAPGAAFVAQTRGIGGMLEPGTELLHAAAEDEGEPDITLEEGHVFLNNDPPPEAPLVAVGGAARRPDALPAPDPAPTSPAAPVAPASAHAAGKRPARQLVPAGEPFAGAPILYGFVRPVRCGCPACKACDACKRKKKVCEHRTEVCHKVRDGDEPAPRRAARRCRAASHIRYTEPSSEDSDGSGSAPSPSTPGVSGIDALVHYAESAEHHLRRLQRAFHGITAAARRLRDETPRDAADDELHGFRVDITDDVETAPPAKTHRPAPSPARSC